MVRLIQQLNLQPHA